MSGGGLDAGHTLLEALVGMALLLLVAGGVGQLYVRTQAVAMDHAAALELQQRARVVLDTIARDVRAAGAGAELVTGAHQLSLPGVWPGRVLTTQASASSAESTRLTMLAVAPTIAQSTAAAAVDASTSYVTVVPAAHCPSVRPACGFSAGGLLVVSDPLSWSARIGTVRTVSMATIAFTTHVASSGTLPIGALVAELSARAYEWSASDRTLRVVIGASAAQPLIDGVERFTVRYFEGAHELSPSALGDGPWLGSGDLAFDADVLRVRRVGVELVLRSGSRQVHAGVDAAVRVHEGGGR